MMRLGRWMAAGVLATCAASTLAQDAGNNAEPLPERFELNAQTLALLNRDGAFIEPQGNGRQRLVTGGGHQHVLMARIGADGRVETFCADSVHSARRWADGEIRPRTDEDKQP